MSTKTNKIKATIAAGAILAVGGITTYSVLTDSATTNIQVTSATFSLDVNDSTTGTYVVDIDAKNLAPGETRNGDITLTNKSSIPAIIKLDKGALENYTASVTDAVTDEAFTTVTLEPGASEELELTVGLPKTETGSPAAENLTVTFNATQGEYS